MQKKRNNIRAEINEVGNKKPIEKVNKTKIDSLKRIIKSSRL
jgi:hypothetical protein